MIGSRLLLGGVVLALGAVTATQAAAAACRDSGRPPMVGFTRSFDAVEYDNSRSQHQLSQQAGNLARDGRIVNGLTVGGYGVRLSVQVDVQPQRGGGACVELVSARGVMGHSGMTVFIANEYRPGSCEYRALMDHEMEHVKVFRHVFDRFGNRLDRRLHAAARRLRPFWVADPARAGEEAAQRLQAELKPVLTEMDREQARLNAAIDTDANYTAVARLCRGW